MPTRIAAMQTSDRPRRRSYPKGPAGHEKDTKKPLAKSLTERVFEVSVETKEPSDADPMDHGAHPPGTDRREPGANARARAECDRAASRRRRAEPRRRATGGERHARRAR